MTDTNTKGWPTYKVKISDYGWTVEFREPSVGELKAIRKARGDNDDDMAKVWEIVACLIKSWDVTDCGGNPLPINAGSFDQVPPSVTTAITAGLVNPQSADPKAVSAS